MFVKNVYTFSNLPVEQNQRKWTDCLCTIIGAIFALTLFIIACCVFTRSYYYQTNYPNDSKGDACYYELQDAPYVYFVNPAVPTSGRYCVSQCPTQGQALKCSINSRCYGVTSTYSTIIGQNRLGAFCLPANQQQQKNLWNIYPLNDKLNLVNSYDVIFLALIIGLCIGLIYLALVMLIPKIMIPIVFFLAFATLLIAAILLIVQPIKLIERQSSTWNIILGIILIIVALFVLFFYFCHRKQINLAGIFMYHANIFLKENYMLFAYIPLFLIFSFGLVVLCIWQYVAFGTINQPEWNQSHIYKSLKSNMLLQILNLIQFLWGIQFIRDSFNYVVSGSAVQWYFGYNRGGNSNCCRPFTRLLCKNFGSVVGGSFLNAFFSIFGIIFDIFRCDPRGSCGRAFKCFKQCCCCCTCLFQLVRPDAYAYIHLSGIPYCNAARQCQSICERSHLFASDHTPIRLYRVAAQIFIVSLTVLLSFILLKSRTDFAGYIIIILVVLTSYLASTHFVDLHANAAEGIVTCYLTEHNLDYPQLQICPGPLRNEIYQYEIQNNLLDG